MEPYALPRSLGREQPPARCCNKSRTHTMITRGFDPEGVELVNTKRLVAVMLNGFLLVGAAAHAQGMGPGPGGGPGGPAGQGPLRGNSGMHRPPVPVRGGPDRGSRGVDPDHYDMNRRWKRGERYDGPVNNRWYVNDWRGHRGLYAPPPGYRWMQYGDQFLLTSIASGLIAGVVSGVISSGMAR